MRFSGSPGYVEWRGRRKGTKKFQFCPQCGAGWRDSVGVSTCPFCNARMWARWQGEEEDTDGPDEAA